MDVTGFSFSRSWLSNEELPVDDINIDLEDPAANESSDDEVVGLLEYATEAHSALEQTMKPLVDYLNNSDSDSDTDMKGEDDEVDVDLDPVTEQISMDISIEDDERTLTMVEPDFALPSDDEKDNPAEIPKQLLVAPQPVLTTLETEVHVPLLTNKAQVPENPQPQFDNVSPPDGHNQETIAEGNTSTKAEDNKDEILRLLQKSFSDLTSVSDLQSFLFLYSRVRVMVSVEKLLELIGETCVTAVNTSDTTIVCGDKVSYNVTSCGSRVEIVWKCKKGHCKKWESSEVLVTKRSSNIYLNDSLQAAAIIISGNNYEKFSLLAKALNLNLISVSTFNRFQKHCAEPVVRDIWQKMNSLI